MAEQIRVNEPKNGQSDLTKTVDDILKLTLGNKKFIRPWWWSGYRCFAALMWLAWVVTLILIILDVVGWDIDISVILVVFFLFGLLGSYAGYKKEME